ncbi:MAG: FtsX-like permease family protein [Bacilli bacterium]
MKFYKRAFLSVTRVFGKTLILFLVTTVLAMGIIISFLIREGINETKKSMASTINLNVTILAYTQEEANADKEALFKTLASSPYVNYYDYSEKAQSIQRLAGDKLYKVNDYPKDEERATTQGLEAPQNPNFLAIKNKVATMAQGRTFTQEELDNGANVVIVSEEYAKVNNFKVGQKIMLQVAQAEVNFMSGENNFSKLNTYHDFEEVEIIGLLAYDESKFNIDSSILGPNATKEEKSNYPNMVKSYHYNTIYTSPGLLKKVVTYSYQNMSESDRNNFGSLISTGFPVYTANDSKDLALFIEEAKTKLNEFKEKHGTNVLQAEVVSDLNLAQKSSDSTKSISNLANLIFYILIGLSILVLTLVVTLFLRDRRHEFGIYMALGEKKSKTLAQVLIETLLIGLCALTFAFALYSIFAQSISKSIIVNNTTQQSDGISSIEDIGVGEIVPAAGSGIDRNYIVNNYQIKIKASDVAIIYLLGVIPLTAARITPIIDLQRLNPKKILM